MFALFFRWCLITLFVLEGLSSEESPSIIFYVDAPNLRYDTFETLCDSLSRVKKGNKKEIRIRQNVGHAWISLHGTLDGRLIDLTLGHSGERGATQRPYFQGVMDLVERNDPSPVAYLFSTLKDGFAQQGSGGHQPTFAAKCEITIQQLREILRFIHPSRYPYAEYGLTTRQCASFVTQIAALLGFKFADKVSVPIPPTFTYGGWWKMRLWSDPRYRTITFSSPDKIEIALKELVKSGKAKEHAY